MSENKITYLAKTNFRNQDTAFGIKKIDRVKHTYIIGKTGTGKTTLQENMAVQDIRNGEGLGIIDPHGSFAEKMLDYIPKERIKDVIYFNPEDVDFPIALNIMEDVGSEQRHLIASGLMGVFKKMWQDLWSARMEYILNNAILALLEYPDSTLLGVNRMLADKEYRKKVVANVKDPVVKAFWEQEFAKYTERFAAEATPAIQNKVGQLTANPIIRNIIGQPKSSFDFLKAMDEKKIVIMNLSKGKIGEQSSSLLGAMLITKIYLAAMSRATDPNKEDLPDFYLYVDEFQNFATEAFKDILSEARKYGLALILAHQYIEQLGDTGVKEAVFGNVGTHVIFRVGAYDAEVLEKEFFPEFTQEDIVNLGFANIYIKLLVDGMTQRPFSAITLPPVEKNEESYKQEIIESSRKKYCRSKEEIEREISEWHAPAEKSVKKDAEGKIIEEEKEEEPPRLFEAACSVCGKNTVVPFKPDSKRPVFCQKHRSYLQEKQAPKTEPAPSVSLPTPPPTTTSLPTPEPSTSSVPTPALSMKSGDVSLRDLGGKTTEFRKDFRPKREKASPDFKGLRELLSEAGVAGDKKPAASPEDLSGDKAGKQAGGELKDESREKPLNPGESIRF